MSGYYPFVPSIEYWQPNEGPQTEVLSRSEDEICMGGGRGSGKTTVGLAWLVEPEYISHPSYRALVIRKNVDDLRDWIERAKVFYKSLNCVPKYNPVEFHFPSGAIIRTGHLKDEDAYGKYQGHEYQKILIEEVTQIPELIRFIKLKGSCRSTVPELKPQLLVTCNPTGPGASWVEERWVKFSEWGVPKQDEEGNWRIYIHSTIYDCPQMLADVSYVNYLNSLPEELRKAWLNGVWGVGEGSFFSEWQPSLNGQPWHVIPTNLEIIKQASHIVRGIDWGISAPFVCLWGAILPPPRRRILIYRELSATSLTATEQAQRVNAYSLGENIVDTRADPACWSRGGSGMSIAGEWESANLFANKANNNRIHGWAKVRKVLREIDEYDNKPILQVMDCCQNLIKYLPKLEFNKNEPEDISSKCHDHEADALRYLLSSDYCWWFNSEEKSHEEQLLDISQKLNQELLLRQLTAQRDAVKRVGFNAW